MNYSIQNNLTSIKNGVIGLLAPDVTLMEPGRVFAVTKLGTIDELRDRLTRSSIEEYLKNEEIVQSTEN